MLWKSKESYLLARHRSFRLFSAQNLSVRTVSKELSVPLSKCIVHRQLQAVTILDYWKKGRSPKFSEWRKNTYVQSSRNHMILTDDWLIVLFNDEMKLNLNVRNFSVSYWFGIRKQQQTFFSRQYTEFHSRCKKHFLYI